MRRLHIGCAGLALCVGALAAPAGAVSLAVANPSFEEVVPGTGFTAFGSGSSFSESAIAGWVNGISTGQWRFSPGNTDFFDSIPDGSTIAWAFGSPISQTVAAKAVAGATYTLSVWTGQRRDYPGAAGQAELIVGGNIVIASGPATISGGWSLLTASYTATGADTGADIGIRLSRTGTAANFDDVRLDASLPNAGVVPEPATWAMLIAGFAVVGVAARRRTTGRMPA